MYGGDSGYDLKFNDDEGFSHMYGGDSESFQIYGSVNIVFPICMGVIPKMAKEPIWTKSFPICVGVILYYGG